MAFVDDFPDGRVRDASNLVQGVHRTRTRSLDIRRKVHCLAVYPDAVYNVKSDSAIGCFLDRRYVTIAAL